MNEYLKATPFFDYDAPELRQWTKQHLAGVPDDPIEKAKALYLGVRDEIDYNPYVFSDKMETFKASHALREGQSYCIPKAVLLGAVARSVGIPSRLGLADVKNHLSSPKLIEWLQSDIFRMHGFIELYLDSQWVKATPAFNSRLCEAMGVEPLEFNGREDSIFQEYTRSGQAHMEYINDHGTFADLPYDFILTGIRKAYGHLFADGKPIPQHNASLERDLDDSTEH